MSPSRTGTSLALGLGLIFGAAHPKALAQTPPSPEKPQAAEPSDERLRQAWSFLLPGEQADAAAYLRDAQKHSESFQQGLIDFARKLEERDLGQLPLAPPTPFYPPDVHAPRQPIERKRLAPDNPQAIRQRVAMTAKLPKNAVECAWHYDWGAREVLRSGDENDPTRLFTNAFNGYPPDLDLAQALIERALDDGAQQATLAAFGHAYTDRAGTVFPGLTLYDAWCSGTEFEMPDVDVLGMIHDLTNDWKTWIAPVPDTQHDQLYGKVEDFFKDAKRHRGLRTALAMTFASGSIGMRDGYGGHRDRFHTWWDECSSTPTELAAQLPKVDDWAPFLEKWSARIDNDYALTQRGIVRRATLDADAKNVRLAAIAILKEFGALERKALPQLPPEPAPEPTKKRDN